MTAPVVTAAADLRAFRISPSDTVRLAVLAGPSTGSGSTLVLEIWDPEGSQPPNSHPGSSETFVVLRGEAVAHSDEHQRPLRPGDTLVLAPGSVHRVVNTSSTARLYAITLMSVDGGFEQLIRSGTPAELDEEDLAVLGLGPATTTPARP